MTETQSAALTGMNADLAPPTQALPDARTALTAAAFAEPRNEAAIRAPASAGSN